MRAEYLLLLLAVIAVPLIFSFDRRLGLYRHTAALAKTLAIVCIGYGIWDGIATARGHWSFNPLATLGVMIANLPFEEVLFFPVIGFVAIFTWEVLKFYLERKR